MNRKATQPQHEYENHNHSHFRDYLVDVSPSDLPALRHLLVCPVCRRLAQLAIPAIPDIPRPRRRQRRRHYVRQHA
jgi:hypothetical protein